MLLICDYSVTPPVVMGHAPDGVTLDMTHEHLIAFVPVPWKGALEQRPKVGPEPELMGDPPTKCYPDHDELDAQDPPVPKFLLDKDGEPERDADGHKIPHPLRLRAGKPYPDNRRRAIDNRPYEAPPQSDPDVQRAYLAHVRWLVEIGGTTVDDFPAFTSRETRSQTEADASRATRDPKFSKRVKGTDGTFHDFDASGLIRVADAVSDHVQACFDAEAELAADIASGKIESFKPINAAFAKLRAPAAVGA